ncbi:MAG: hypothetical protein QOI20_2665 [Acidimicrobiaceae bacterium]|nr:hypothetical protein [Acidimicrobiaceae bacterium]
MTAGLPDQSVSMATPWACSAKAWRSARSPVSTVPPGSATAATTASTAEPRLAFVRNEAARRANASGIASRTSQVRRKRFAAASLGPSPLKLSTRTTLGTSGGHKPSSRSARISASARGDLSESRVTAPESRTSTSSPCAPRAALRDSSRGRASASHVRSSGLVDLRRELLDVVGRLGQQVLTPDFCANRVLQQLRRGQLARLHLFEQLVGEVDLHPRHTPNSTHTQAILSFDF